MSARQVAVLGVGMHPWGKWGDDFTSYGMVAARTALADAGLQWTDVQYVAGADTIRNGYPGFVSGSTFAQKLSDTITAGIGNLVDANMAQESARLQSLQVKQQLGIQALSIANQGPQTILALFR